MNKLARFLCATVVLALVIGVVLELLVLNETISKKPSFSYPTLILLAFITVVMYRYLLAVPKPNSFVQLYLFFIVFKLLAFLGYNVLMVLKNKTDAKYNVLFFLISYILFTALEVAFLFRRIAGKNPS